MRKGTWLWLMVGACAVVGAWSHEVHAAAEVHRLNLVISGIPTSVSAGEFNSSVDEFNRINLESRGLEGLNKIHSAWLFDLELRYFVRPNIAVSAGVGQLRQMTRQEYLPALNAQIQLRSEILSVPIHVGGSYYLQPYNVGDFRAQAYMGGGFISGIYNRAKMGGVATGVDSATAVAANYNVYARGDSPGYYVDAGVHMFFPVRFSILISALYRSQVVRNLRGYFKMPDGTEVFLGDPASYPPGFPLSGVEDFDVSGVGARLAAVIGF
jgi:hypothetical protein